MSVAISEHSILIRKAGSQDVEAIAAITRAAYTKYIPLIGREPQPMTADYARMVVDHSIWLLTVASQPVGVLVLIAEPETLLIYSVAILPEFQQRGLGRRLLAWAESQAIQAGYRSIRLYTNGLFVDNLRLYRSLGYQETGREVYRDSTLVHMAKQLAAVQTK
jgi:ribosomal protein S18 acetylase RimI-like enzyme